MNTVTLDFSNITPVEIPTIIGGENYVLKEATGEVAKLFQNARLNKVKFEDGKPTSIGNIAEIEPYLVSLCIFKVVDGRHVAVTQKTVESWLYRIQSKLYDTAKKISDLDRVESPIQELIKEAFNNPDAPTTSEAILDWIEQLKDEKFDRIKVLFEDTESSAKK